MVVATGTPVISTSRASSAQAPDKCTPDPATIPGLSARCRTSAARRTATLSAAGLCRGTSMLVLGTTARRGSQRVGHEAWYVGRSRDGGSPLGHRREEQLLIYLRQRAGTSASAVDVGGYDQHRYGRRERFPQTSYRVGHPTTARNLHCTYLVGAACVHVSHVRCVTLVVRHHVAEPMAAMVQRVVEGDACIAR